MSYFGRNVIKKRNICYITLFHTYCIHTLLVKRFGFVLFLCF